MNPIKMLGAYVFLLCNVEYLRMTTVAVRSLLATGPSMPIVVMTVGHVPGAVFPTGVVVETVAMPATLGQHQWRCTFAKLYAARLTSYERVIVLDSDVLVLENLDHLFNVDPGDSLAAPPAYWLQQPFFTSGGPLIVNTGATKFADVLDNELSVAVGGEMDYINSRYSKTIVPLHESYTTLIGQWHPPDAIFKRITGRPMMVHFVASWKPPLSAKQVRSLTRVGQVIYRRWEAMAQRS